jgi:hypothetical protein
MNEDLQKSPMQRDIANQAAAKVAVQPAQSAQSALGNVAGSAPALAPATVSVPSSWLVSIENKIASIRTDVSAIAAKDVGIIEKYWPIAVGIVIALTRFL